MSVHATEPEVRERLLVNQRAGLIMDQLRELIDGGLEVHTQVVLCPEWNDGAHLDRTIEDLWGLGAGHPVALDRSRWGLPGTTSAVLCVSWNADEAGAAIDRVDEARARALAERDFGWCYAADEMYLIAGREIPSASYYDDGALYEKRGGRDPSLRRRLRRRNRRRASASTAGACAW